jgi:hypothetical protein
VQYLHLVTEVSLSPPSFQWPKVDNDCTEHKYAGTSLVLSYQTSTMFLLGAGCKVFKTLNHDSKRKALNDMRFEIIL